MSQSETKVTPQEFANLLSPEIAKIYTPSTGNLKARSWEKLNDDKTLKIFRIYITTHKGGDCGFIEIEKNGCVSVGVKSYIFDQVDKAVDLILNSVEVQGF